MSNRLNDMEKDAIVIIMQRVHEDDVSGVILSAGLDYVHLMIPMEYEANRQFMVTATWSLPVSGGLTRASTKKTRTARTASLRGPSAFPRPQ